MRFFLPTVACILFFGSCSRPNSNTNQPAEPASNEESGPDGYVVFPEDDTFLPPDWLTAPVSATCEPLDKKHQQTTRAIIERALAKYPPALLEKSLDGIYLVGSLRFYNVGYGGTYMANRKRIVLVYRDSFNDRGFEQRFHHEFSSLLLKKNEIVFEESRWKKANPDTFVYRAPGVIEEQTGDRSEATRALEEEQKKTGGSGSSLLKITPDLMEDGFLTPYNQVSLEQDLNETAAHLFTNPDLWRYCEEFPRIDHKVDVLIDFYRSLHPKFDRLYFRNLTKLPPAPITTAPAP